MTVTADNRERELIRCDGCRRLTRTWRHVAITIDGANVRDVQVCRACEYDSTRALDQLWNVWTVAR